MAGSKHDRRTLILLYKLVFQGRYPADKYSVVFDPDYRPISTLPFLPDILIREETQIVKWVEVGQLHHDKALAVINHIGKDQFIHIPYTDPIFSLIYVHDPSPTLGIDLNLNNQLVAYETRLIKMALERAEGKRTEAAKYLGITVDSLKYRLTKIND